MATLTPTLTLASTDFSASEALSLSITDSLTIGAPSQGMSTVIATATGGGSIIVPAGTAVTYLYVRHTGTTDGSTATAQMVDIEDTADVAFCRLAAGEFAFFPANKAGGSTGVQLQVAHASVVQCEYMYFTKA